PSWRRNSAGAERSVWSCPSWPYALSNKGRTGITVPSLLVGRNLNRRGDRPPGTSACRRLVRCFEEDIPVHAYVEPVADRHLNRRLDIEISPGDIRAQLRNLPTDGAPRRFRR